MCMVRSRPMRHAVVADESPDSGVGEEGGWRVAFVDMDRLEDGAAAVGIGVDGALEVARCCKRIELVRVVD